MALPFSSTSTFNLEREEEESRRDWKEEEGREVEKEWWREEGVLLKWKREVVWCFGLENFGRREEVKEEVKEDFLYSEVGASSGSLSNLSLGEELERKHKMKAVSLPEEMETGNENILKEKLSFFHQKGEEDSENFLEEKGGGEMKYTLIEDETIDEYLSQAGYSVKSEKISASLSSSSSLASSNSITSNLNKGTKGYPVNLTFKNSPSIVPKKKTSHHFLQHPKFSKPKHQTTSLFHVNNTPSSLHNSFSNSLPSSSFQSLRLSSSSLSRLKVEVEEKRSANSESLLLPQVENVALSQFHECLSILSDHSTKSYETRIRTYSLLSQITSNFLHEAQQYGKIIISELNLPLEQKTIKPINKGGILGGEKFVVNSILFKLALDKHFLFKGVSNPFHFIPFLSFSTLFSWRKLFALKKLLGMSS